MIKKLIITIRLEEQDTGSRKIKEEVQVLTKSDIFKLPVEALVVTREEFE